MTATPADNGASIRYIQPTNADPDTDCRQVDLGPGLTSIFVGTTTENRNTAWSYSVTVTRAADTTSRSDDIPDYLHAYWTVSAADFNAKNSDNVNELENNHSRVARPAKRHDAGVGADSPRSVSAAIQIQVSSRSSVPETALSGVSSP